MTPDRICAAFDPYDKGGAYLRVDDAGFELFREWRAGLEHRLRSGELHPAVESHLAKYRKLVPSLALIHHLAGFGSGAVGERSEEHTSELQSLMRISYAVFCLKKKKIQNTLVDTSTYID